MGLTWLFFSFQGRINRAIWWGVQLGTAALLIGLVFLLSPSAELYLVISLAMLGLRIAPSVKRLQDRDKSGWWVVVFFILPLMLEYFGGSLFMAEPPIYTFALAAALIQLWALVELGVLAGTLGPNRFGPDPLAGRARRLGPPRDPNRI